MKAFSKDDVRLEKLHNIIKDKSLQIGEFELTSGKTSNYYFQLQQTTLLPKASFLIGHLVTQFMYRHKLNCIGGIEFGAVPIIMATGLIAYHAEFDITTFCLRKKKKDHGAKQLINGEIPPKARVLLVDDVSTTGSSILKVYDELQNYDCVVDTALTIVDREEGAEQNLANQAITLHSFFQTSDFGPKTKDQPG